MPIVLVSLLIPRLPVELLQVSSCRRYLVYQLSYSLKRLIGQELLAKLSTRYKTIQSVLKRYIHYCRASLLQYAILCRLTVRDNASPAAQERDKSRSG